MNTKIVRVRCIGSRKNGDLKPDLWSKNPDLTKPELDDLPHVSLTVLEYINNDAEAIVQLFGSEHESVEFKVKQKDLEEVTKHRAFLQELSDHPKKTKRYLYVNETQCSEMNEDSKTLKHHVKKVNTETLEETVETKTISFIRKFGRNNLVVVDE
jgi:hypothetical protein